jgi:hypothetical protein
MANDFFPTYSPGLRVVNSVGTVLYGPTLLDVPHAGLSNGVVLASARVEAQPELLGTWTTFGFAHRWRLLGYRYSVVLRFALMESSPGITKYGLDLIRYYYDAGLTSESFAALQFNLYASNAVNGSPWRGVYPTTAWNPVPVGGKQVTGHEMTLNLQGRDLISSVGNWGDQLW